MTMFSIIPPLISGGFWYRPELQQYFVDNLNFFNSQLGGGGMAFSVNDVIIGAVGGGLAGVELDDEEILIGTNGAPVALAPGTGFLRSVNGVVSYGQPDVTINLADIVKYT